MPKTNISSKKLDKIIVELKEQLKKAKTMGDQTNILEDITKEYPFHYEKIITELQPTTVENINRFVSKHTTVPDSFSLTTQFGQDPPPKGGRKRKTRSNKKSTKKGKKAKKNRKTKKNRRKSNCRR